MRRWPLVFAVLLAACQSAPISIPIPRLAASTATPARLRANPADTIAIGLAKEPTTLAAPPLEGAEARLVGQLVFSQLVGLDDKLQPRPDLAQSVPTIQNGGAGWLGEGDARQLQVTFKLRPSARWSDGQPVTARDVVFTWQLALNPVFGNAIAIERCYEKVEAVDDATAVFTFFSERSARAAAAREPARYGFLAEQKGPVLDPLYVYGLPDWWVYPSHVLGLMVENAPRSSMKAVDALAKGDFARKPVGSGPFRADGLTFVARPDYVGGAPKTARIVVKAAGVEALRRGEVDALLGESAEGVEVGPGIRVERAQDTAWERLDLNLGPEALTDPGVRQALAAALDGRALAKTARGTMLEGLPGASERGLVVEAPPNARDATIVKQAPPRGPSLEAAARLLDAAGWTLGADGVRNRNGKRLQLRLLTTDSPLRTRLAGTIAQQFAQIGVETRVEARPPAELFDRPSGRLARRDFDLALYASIGGLDPLGDIAAWYGSAAIPSRASGFGGDNVVGLRNEEVERIVREGAGILEASRRLELLHEAVNAVARDTVTIPLFAYGRPLAADTRIENLHPAPGLVGETWNAAAWRLNG